MAKLTRDDVLKLARLARLRLDDSEIESYRENLNEILGYVEMLQNVDTSGLEPTSQVTGLVNVMRKDTPKDYGYSAGDLLRNVPSKDGSYIKTKRILN